jgi:hypothetical protein
VLSRQRPIERLLAQMMASVTEAGRPGGFTVLEMRSLIVEYLNDFDEELARHPELADSGHWNLWMDDTDLNDAVFVVAIVRRSGLEFFCGRGTARAIRDFGDNWVGDVDGVQQEARRRLAVSDKVVRVGRRAAESWLGRGLFPRRPAPAATTRKAMTPLFTRLNLGTHRDLLVVNAPDSFEAELSALTDVTIHRDRRKRPAIPFALVFVQTRAEVEAAAKWLPKAGGDAVIWFVYPKGSSKRYHCEFNRDTGWAAVRAAGFESVRQVAIDEDWSALRFRRTEYIKSLTRYASRAKSPQGKAGAQKKGKKT